MKWTSSYCFKKHPRKLQTMHLQLQEFTSAVWMIFALSIMLSSWKNIKCWNHLKAIWEREAQFNENEIKQIQANKYHVYDI